MSALKLILCSLLLLACSADQDWAQLGRYNVSNAILAKLPAGTNQVIFLGDSITDFWPNVAPFFPGKPYVDRGIGGQTTGQMLVRFHEDVVDLQPLAVLILAGTNDIAGGQGWAPNVIIQKNLQTISELAVANNIKPILASLLPVCGGVVAQRPPATILALNQWIQNYTIANNLVYLDYFSQMVGTDGLLIQNLTGDCLHPNAAGYAIMAPLAEAAIEQALSQSKGSKHHH